jgi:hypothetical protein
MVERMERNMSGCLDSRHVGHDRVRHHHAFWTGTACRSMLAGSRFFTLTFSLVILILFFDLDPFSTSLSFRV